MQVSVSLQVVCSLGCSSPEVLCDLAFLGKQLETQTLHALSNLNLVVS